MASILHFLKTFLCNILCQSVGIYVFTASISLECMAGIGETLSRVVVKL